MDLQVYSKDSLPIAAAGGRSKRSDRYFYALILLVGISSILFAVWPFIVWQVSIGPRLNSGVSVVPVPQSKVLGANVTYAQDVQIIKDEDGFSYFATSYKPQGPRPKEFYVTIPKLNIFKAQALVDNLNFTKNLSHFPGSALPGEVGNVFITGHSVLPQFNDPKDYNKIFTKLEDLEIGDKIEVTLDGKTYEYLVQYSKVVSPRDISVLAPISKNGKNLTLMTCVPPGTSLKRLVVISSLI